MVTKTKHSLPKTGYGKRFFTLADRIVGFYARMFGDWFGITAAYNHDLNELRMRALGLGREERESVRNMALELAKLGVQEKDLQPLVAHWLRTGYADLNDNTKEVAG